MSYGSAPLEWAPTLLTTKKAFQWQTLHLIKAIHKLQPKMYLKKTVPKFFTAVTFAIP
jgi:hypothetical protein